MLPFVKKGIAETKLGKPPGTIIQLSNKTKGEVEFELIKYNSEKFEQKIMNGSNNIPAPEPGNSITWISIFGHSDINLINRIAELYEIHQLAMEDILNPDHRPKIDFLENKILIILKMISIDNSGMIDSEQVSIVLGENYVLTFQEKPGDLFDPIRERLKKHIGRIRTMTSDYLAFSLIDIIVDNYFVVLESIAGALEKIELMLVNDDPEFNQLDIHDAKMQVFYLRKLAWPLREIAHSLQKSEMTLIRQQTRVYFADLYDHSIRVLETAETLREVVNSITELHMNNTSFKMNEIMKTLTIISTIFMPMTFIAGIYGMNFEYMPELKWHWGYFGALGLMITLAATMLIYFRRKRWI
ncbi:MAG: magnesium/cobalt transporter CorA [Candidatus Rifleibacteriota bacterium]